MVQNGYTLSPQQRRVWDVQQQGTPFVVQARFRIEGELDSERLHQCLRQLIADHLPLHTRYRHKDGVRYPLQMPDEECTYAYALRDVGQLTDAEQAATIVDEWHTPSRTDIASDEWMPVHLTCFRRNARQHVCILRVAALAADGFSLPRMVASLAERYLHPENGSSHKPLISYVQFSEWQNKLLETPDAHAEAFWQDVPLATLPLSGISFQKSVDVLQPLRYQTVSWPMPAEWLPQAETLAQSCQTDVATLCLATLKLLLHKHTTLETVVTGLVTSGRAYEQLHGTIGLLAKMLPIPVEIAANQSFTNLLTRTHQAITTATGWAAYFSTQYLIRDTTDIPLVPTGLEWVDLSQPLPASERMSFVWEDCQCLTEPFGLKITCLKTIDGLTIQLTYDTASLEPEAVPYLQQQYDTLLKNTVQTPYLPLSQLSSLNEAEQQLVVHDFQSPEEDAEQLGIIDLFEQQVTRTPEATALIFKGQRITYAELQAQIHQKARELTDRQHLRPGDRLPILLERSPEAIVTMLAALKLGAAYVPIDPNYPEKRIQYILESLPPTPPQERELDASPARSVPKETEFNSPSCGGGGGEAYLIYTSGSTGTPKGVQVTMANLVNYVTWANRYYFSGEGRKTFALFTSLAFDLTVTSIFTTLLRGDAVHIFPENDMQQVLPQLFDPASGIDVVKLTPSHISLLKVLDLPATAVSHAIVGGEAFTQDQAATLWKLNPQMRIFNEYGPTETTVGSTVAEVYPSDVQITIGKPIARTQVYVLNEHNQPVAVGEVGELCISGAGVAQGYWQRPDLTAERFVENPFRPQEKMYRTGDWGRWLPDGQLQYLGRRDSQVKIRGYRIETEEIEKVLLRQPGIQHAAVTARGEGDSRYLIGYLVSQETLDTEAIRQILAAELPEFMVPSYLVAVDKLPLTIHGKTDWDKLPALPEIAGRAACVAPRTPLETVLQQIWADVLGNANIGVLDNFFAIGGQSIKALQIITRISRQLQVSVSLTALFADPTIAGLAHYIEQAGKTAWQAIEPLPEQEFYEVSFAQRRLWILDSMGTHKGIYNMPGACVLEGDLDRDVFTKSIHALHQRHESLRTTFATVDNIPKQKIHPAEALPPVIQYTDLRTHPNQEAYARTLVAEEAIAPFDLVRGPLWRVGLLQLDEQKYIVTFTLHHIIGDAWSVGVLIQEMTALYNAFQEGRSNPLTPLRIQYKDYTAWQNNQLADTESLRAYWQTQFTPLPPRLKLSADFPRPRVKTLAGKRLLYALPPELRLQLDALGSQHGVSLFTVLLSAFYTLLYRLTRQTDLVIGTSVAGRDHLELEPQIGFFVNLLALRTQVAGIQSFAELLDAVHARTTGAFEHQLYPFDRLIDDLKLEREFNRSPLFDLLVVMQNTHITELDTQLNGVQVSMLGAEVDKCEFDLIFNLIPSEDQLTIAAHYSTELFEEETILIFLEKLHLICQAVTQDTTLLLDAIPMELEAERQLNEKKADMEFNF